MDCWVWFNVVVWRAIDIRFDFTCLTWLTRYLRWSWLRGWGWGVSRVVHVCAAAEVVQKQEHGAWMWGSRRGAQRWPGSPICFHQSSEHRCTGKSAQYATRMSHYWFIHFLHFYDISNGDYRPRHSIYSVIIVQLSMIIPPRFVAISEQC